MTTAHIVKIALILGLALYITYILTSLALSVVMPILPLAFLGVFSTLVEIIITILAMGLIGGIVIKYVV